ncbi:hypothetical protein FA95DRAFT_1279590 [Auriscalpium vulgare]|uniref:Uncharacterized protein n=1 Tax=Auriscalpium vulgare TaxID=40419 RepID=A0ACB8R349_9AGAM|nr:hypothetical protein FA95DRAFT_1279590 [Auriscalpium vulgare]
MCAQPRRPRTRVCRCAGRACAADSDMLWTARFGIGRCAATGWRTGTEDVRAGMGRARCRRWTMALSLAPFAQENVRRVHPHARARAVRSFVPAARNYPRPAPTPQKARGDAPCAFHLDFDESWQDVLAKPVDVQSQGANPKVASSSGYDRNRRERAATRETVERKGHQQRRKLRLCANAAVSG